MGNQLSSSKSTGKLVLAGTGIAAIALSVWKLGFFKSSSNQSSKRTSSSKKTVIAGVTHAGKIRNLLLAGAGIAAVALAWKLGFFKCSKRKTKEVNNRSNDSPQEAELSDSQLLPYQSHETSILIDDDPTDGDSQFLPYQSHETSILIDDDPTDGDSQLLHYQSHETSILIDDDPTDGDSQLLDEVCDSGSFRQREIKIMTYNLCHPKKESLQARMMAVTLLVQKHMPDVVLFQEATSRIHNILICFSVWDSYQCVTGRNNCMVFSKLPMISMDSVPFTGGGELLLINTDSWNGKHLIIATTHLKCSTWNSKAVHKDCRKRTSQAKEAMETLNHFQNIILGGDMNWRYADGRFPLKPGWIDAWEHIMPHKPGYTFDTRTNPFLKGRKMSRQRFDRFLCKLNNFEPVDIKIIGNEDILVPYESSAILQYKPVTISDHYGLILTVSVI